MDGCVHTLPTHIYVQTTCKVNFASDDPFKRIKNKNILWIMLSLDLLKWRYHVLNIVIILYHGVHQNTFTFMQVTCIAFNILSIHAFPGNRTYNLRFIMPCQDVRTLKPRGLIRHGSPWDFPMAYYNGVFQFMSKIRSVVNISWLYLMFFWTT